jgi:hypothetical protein
VILEPEAGMDGWRMVCAALISLTAAHAARAEATPTLASAQGFVEGVYRAYCDDCKGPDFASPRLLSPRLLALVRRDRRLTPPGDVGALDGDPICDCQDWMIRGVRVDIRAAGANRAVAAVRFRNTGRTISVTLDLLATRGGWRIDNIHSKSIPDLARFLSDHTGRR